MGEKRAIPERVWLPIEVAQAMAADAPPDAGDILYVRATDPNGKGRRIKIRMLKDITPPGWTSTFEVETSRFEYDAISPRAKKTHQLIFQRGRNYGAVGDMCAGFTHDELLQLERDGFVRIERG